MKYSSIVLKLLLRLIREKDFWPTVRKWLLLHNIVYYHILFVVVYFAILKISLIENCVKFFFFFKFVIFFFLVFWSTIKHELVATEVLLGLSWRKWARGRFFNRGIRLSPFIRYNSIGWKNFGFLSKKKPIGPLGPEPPIHFQLFGSQCKPLRGTIQLVGHQIPRVCDALIHVALEQVVCGRHAGAQPGLSCFGNQEKLLGVLKPYLPLLLQVVNLALACDGSYYK